MAYSSTNQVKRILDTGLTSGSGIWQYTSTHAHAQVEAANFFNGCGFGSQSNNCVGMAVGDLVVNVCQTTAASSAVTWHVVTSLSTSTGWGSAIHASVSAASS